MKSEKDQQLKLATRPQIAKQIGGTCRTVDGWVQRGILPRPIISNGRITRWSADAVDRALNGGGV